MNRVKVDKVAIREIPIQTHKETIKKGMIHAPFSNLNHDVPCMENNKYSKDFSKEFRSMLKQILMDIQCLEDDQIALCTLAIIERITDMPFPTENISSVCLTAISI